MRKIKKSLFNEVCPRQLKQLPTEKCPSALLKLEFIQNGKRDTPDLPGCPYYVNDCMSCFCWFNYANRDEFSAHTTREIAQILNLTPAQIEKAEKSAIEKLTAIKSSEEMLLLQEIVAEMNMGNEDDTIYSIGSFSVAIIEELGKTFDNLGGETENGRHSL
jgi:hypothetical protein